MHLSRWTAGLCAVVAVGAAQAGAPAWSEGFDDFGALAGAGWVFTNASSDPGEAWFEGNSDVFEAQAGAPGAYAAANFLSTEAFDGSISNWLITPEIALAAGQTLTFYTRSDYLEDFPLDGLNVWVGAGGDASLANFTTLMGSVGEAFTGVAYPGGWTQVSFAIPDLPGLASGRIAFEYAVADATLGNYIGIDSIALVPEPGSYALFGLGLAALALRRRSLQ